MRRRAISSIKRWGVFPIPSIRSKRREPIESGLRYQPAFVRLCREAKVPELTPVFCAVDASYFGGVEPAVSLERPTTLAQGGPCCDFRLQFVDEGPVE